MGNEPHNPKTAANMPINIHSETNGDEASPVLIISAAVVDANNK